MRPLWLLTGIAIIGCGGPGAGRPDLDAPLINESDYTSQSGDPDTGLGAPIAQARADLASPPAAIRRADLDRVLDAGPAALLAEVWTEPARKDGRFLGFRITGFRRGSPAAVDLRPGDVVLAVNGRPIERPEQFYELFQALRAATALELELLRGGETVKRVYPIVE